MRVIRVRHSPDLPVDSFIDRVDAQIKYEEEFMRAHGLAPHVDNGPIIEQGPIINTENVTEQKKRGRPRRVVE